MSNVLGTIGARRNVKMIPVSSSETPGRTLPRGVQDVKDHADLELIEEDGEYYIIDLTAGYDMLNDEWVRKERIRIEEDNHKDPPVPRAWISDLGVTDENLMRDESGKLVPTSKWTDKGKSKKSKKKKKKSKRDKEKKRAKDIGLNLDVENKEKLLNEYWTSDEPVTRDEVRLLGLKVSELTGVGPFPIDFKSMKTRWASFRYKTQRISYSDELGTCREFYWYLVAHEYSHATRPEHSDESTHGSEFKERERDLLEEFGLKAVYKSSKSGRLEYLMTTDGDIICDDDGVYIDSKKELKVSDDGTVEGFEIEL